MRPTFLPYCLPSIGEDEIAEVVDTLRSGWLTTGPKVRRFEEEVAAYVSAPHALAVNSCTAALHLALAALDIGPGDEVIVPTMTFCATANVVVHQGATPVLADVDHTGHLTAEAIEQAITSRTRAVIPVHYAGETCDMDEIHAVARRHNLRVIEDAAHAIGASYHDRQVGSSPESDAVCFSFYATKNMTTGEGGMVTTHDKGLADRMRTLSLHGMSHNAWNRYSKTGSWQYEVQEAGFKYNLNEIQAALGIHQLRRLDDFIERRREIAAAYQRELGDVPGLRLPFEQPGRRHIYHLYVVQVDSEQAAIGRDEFIQNLKDSNIGTSVHFIPLHRHPVYRDRFGYCSREFPVAEYLFKGIVSLPLYPAMSDSDVADVIDAVHSATTAGRLTAASTAERY